MSDKQQKQYLLQLEMFTSILIWLSFDTFAFK